MGSHGNSNDYFSESIPIRVGDLLAGKYRVERILGSGGMGVVVAARHLQLDAQVAIKFLLPVMLHNPDAVARFTREARAAVRIKSEHSAHVTDVGTLESGVPYMVMEYLEGIDLSTWLLERGPLPLALAVGFVLQACEAIAEAHALGIVHRDIKPGNLFVTRHSDGTDQVKVLDFGISKVMGADAAMTDTSAIMGSPLYMSPEQLQSSRDVDARSDIWALGIVLYELVTGIQPFTAETMAQLMMSIMTQPPAPLPARLPHVPAGFEQTIARCLAKDRNLRIQSIDELAVALFPFAPPGARASVERIRGTSSAGERADVPRDAPPSAQSVGQSTGAAWGNTGTRVKSPWHRWRPWKKTKAQPSEVHSPWSAEGAPSQKNARATLASFTANLPVDHRPNAVALWHFLNTVFTEVALVDVGVFSLHTARMQEARRCEYFAVFMGVSREVIGSATFVGSVKPLESYLKSLGHKKRKMVIAVSYAKELGPGVSEKIVEYMHTYNARVVPMHVDEIVDADEDHTSQLLFLDRLAEFELPNLFKTDGPSSPASLVGLRDTAARAVLALKEDGAMVSMYGFPGSGKSSLLRMVEFGLMDTPFIRFRCNVMHVKTFLALAFDIAERLVGKEVIGKSPSASIHHILSLVDLARYRPDLSRPVLVFEDADWAIDALLATETNVRDSAREFWTGIAHLASARGLRVVVTSVRGFVLAHRKIEEWENPLCTNGLKAWPVPFLEPRAVETFIRRIGAEIDVDFSEEAVREVAFQSGGHVGVVRQLCGEVVTDCREAITHPMMTLRVGAKDVRAVAKRLAAMSPTFGDSLFVWYSRTEQRVLKVLATRNVRSKAQLVAALPSESSEDVDAAFIGTQETGLVAFEGSKYCVRIPLFRSWIARHVDRDPTEPIRATQRRLAALSLGISTVSVAFATYCAVKGAPSWLAGIPSKTRNATTVALAVPAFLMGFLMLNRKTYHSLERLWNALTLSPVTQAQKARAAEANGRDNV